METACRSGARFRSLDFAVTGRRIGDEGIEQLACHLLHLLHRAAERRLVCFGGARESAQLANELQGRRTDLLIRGGRLAVIERLDVLTHENLAGMDDSDGGIRGRPRSNWRRAAW